MTHVLPLRSTLCKPVSCAVQILHKSNAKSKMTVEDDETFSVNSDFESKLVSLAADHGPLVHARCARSQLLHTICLSSRSAFVSLLSLCAQWVTGETLQDALRLVRRTMWRDK